MGRIGARVVWIVRVTLAVALIGGTLAVGQAAVAAAPRVQWSPCHRDLGAFDCATVQVPLDYGEPNGAQISLALVRVRATGDPSERIGSLFVNPGGPGNSGVDLVLFEGPTLFPPEVHEQFDVVGFDPRGVARSTGLRCFGNTRQRDAIAPPFPFPVTEDEEDAWIAAERTFDARCAQTGGRIAEHISTGNVARDLDQLRAAVGDEKLSYYGVSYGTVIGQTYANLFPERVRAIGLDSVVDPIAWTNEGGSRPTTSELGSAAGAQATLDELFRLCDASPAACALAPSSSERFAALADQLRGAPIGIDDPDLGHLDYTYSFLVSDTLDALYDAASWPSFAELLAFLESQPVGLAEVGRARAAFHEALGGPLGTKRGFSRYDNWVEGQAATACSDTGGPSSYQAWIEAAHAVDPAAGYFGGIWTWFTSICAEWPYADQDRYTGPWSAATANPVLVIGTRFDPATPYRGAQTVAGLLPSSALLTVDGWGHVAVGESACADAVIAGYLIDLEVPATGAVCSQDYTPFAGPLPS